jgi:hypothetical protein
VLAGDIDRNRAVNTDDFIILASNFGRSGRTYAQGDLDGSGTVDSNDFVILAANFGRTVPAPSAAPAGPAKVQQAVPASVASAPTRARKRRRAGAGRKA